MVDLVWSEPALSDLDAIAGYIAIDNPQAARALVQRVFKHVDQLEAHPDSGPVLTEFHDSRYRQIVESPCRVICRHDELRGQVFIVHVMRHEQKLRPDHLRRE